MTEVIAIYLAERMGGVLGYNLLLATVKKIFAMAKGQFFGNITFKI